MRGRSRRARAGPTGRSGGEADGIPAPTSSAAGSRDATCPPRSACRRRQGTSSGSAAPGTRASTSSAAWEREKTYEACALAKSFIEAGYTVRVTTSLAMLDSVSRSYDDPVDNAGHLEFHRGRRPRDRRPRQGERQRVGAHDPVPDHQLTLRGRQADHLHVAVRPAIAPTPHVAPARIRERRGHSCPAICETSTIVQLGGKDRRRSAKAK